MQPNITIIDLCKICIAAFSFPILQKSADGDEEELKTVNVSQATIDLTPNAGQHVRIWLCPDGSYTVDPKKEHFWQIMEFDVPEIQYQQVDTGEIDEDGNPIMTSEALPLDLADAEIKTWDLPGEDNLCHC